MKTIALGIALAGCLFAQQAPTLNDSKIMGLAQAGVSETELLRMVSSAEKFDFDLRPVSTEAMMKSGLSERVIQAMAAREKGSPVPVNSQPNSPSDAQPAAMSVLPVQRAPIAEPPRAPVTTAASSSAIQPGADSRTRIFVGETSEWQASSFNIAHSAASYSAFSGSAAAGAFGMSHAGLMKLTIPVMNQLSRHCPGILIVNTPDVADLFVRLDQSTSMWARHDDMAVFNCAGEMVFVTSTHSISKDAKRFCSTLTPR